MSSKTLTIKANTMKHFTTVIKQQAEYKLSSNIEKGMLIKCDGVGDTPMIYYVSHILRKPNFIDIIAHCLSHDVVSINHSYSHEDIDKLFTFFKGEITLSQ